MKSMSDDVGHSEWDHLWHPIRSVETHYNKHSCERVKNRIIGVWVSFDDYELPSDIDWGADPFENKTWKLYFNSLNWLYALFWGIDNERDDPALLHSYVMEYCSYLLEGDVNDMAWFDHATSDRLCFLAALLSHPSTKSLDGEMRTVIEQAIHLHIDNIKEYYDSELWFDNNHGIFHAMALINISHIFSEGTGGFDVKKLGTDYLRIALSGIIDVEDGISLEQSLYYHQLAIELLETIPFNALDDIDLDIEDIIKRMILSNGWFTLNGRLMPAIGDTSLIAHAPAKYMPDNSLEYGMRVYARGGMTIVKNINEGLIDHFTMLHRLERAAHGHFDALSITLSHNNKQFLIDSGGPYNYGSKIRYSYFISNLAHNVIVINGKTHQSGAAFLGSTDHGNRNYSVAALHRGYEPIVHRRDAFILHDCGVIVVDTLEGIREMTRLDILWHIHPDCEVDAALQPIRLHHAEQNVLIHTHPSFANSHSIISGSEDDQPQGWVTEGIANKRPCPTIVFSTSCSKPTTITTFFQFGECGVTDVTVNEAGGVTMKRGGQNVSISFEEGVFNLVETTDHHEI